MSDALRAAALAVPLAVALAVPLATSAAAADDPKAEATIPAPTPWAAANGPVAVLEGETLTLEDVQAPVAFRIYTLQVDIHHLLQTETERRVDEILLAREAQRRGTTPEALLAEAEAGVAPVADEDVEAYLAEHPPSGPTSPEDARMRVRHFLEETRRIEKRLAFQEGLRRGAHYRFVLPRPEPPRTAIDVDGAPARGPEDATITIVHFATFTSRHSARSAEHLARLREEFPGRLRQVHRNLLRPRDEAGLLAARLGHRAADEGLFWALHDRWFDAGGTLDAEAVEEAARAAGLGDEDLRAARTDPALLARVKRDADAAAAAGAPREPTLFVNGRYVSGLQPYEEIRVIVLEELGESPKSE